MRLFNLNDNKGDTEGNKKVIKTITNNNRCKPIKKGKNKISEMLFVNNDNKNKVNDKKEEIKKYFFYKCFDTKTVVDEKN